MVTVCSRAPILFCLYTDFSLQKKKEEAQMKRYNVPLCGLLPMLVRMK